MNKFKASLAAGISLVVGVVTLRAIRKRRTNPKEEAETAIEEAVTEATSAVNHAAAAIGHARVAAEKAVEYTSEEVNKTVEDRRVQ